MYVISYDITSDRIRKKVADTLLEYGKRIQYSVFECDISKKKLTELYKKLSEITVDTKEGNIRIYWICSNCREKIRTIGTLKEEKKFNREEVIIL